MLGRGFRRLLANVVIVPDTRTKYVYITDVKRLEIKFKNIYRKEKEREQKVTLQLLFKKNRVYSARFCLMEKSNYMQLEKFVARRYSREDNRVMLFKL